MKNFFSISLILILIFRLVAPMPAFAQRAPSFLDVDTDHPYFVEIEVLARTGFLEGTPDGFFWPKRPVNRAEAAVMIGRLLGTAPSLTDYSNCYADVREDWFAPYVCFQFPGNGSDFFHPSQALTVAEFIDMASDQLGPVDAALLPLITTTSGELIDRAQAATTLYHFLISYQYGAEGADWIYEYQRERLLADLATPMEPAFITPSATGESMTIAPAEPLAPFSPAPSVPLPQDPLEAFYELFPAERPNEFNHQRKSQVTVIEVPAPAPILPNPPPPDVTPPPAQEPTEGAQTPPATFARVYAPYADMGLWPTFNMTQTANTTGVKNYTMAFINSRGCDATWFGIVGLNDPTYPFGADINNLRALGGDVIVSFGGATGIELAQACDTVSALQAQYQRVVTQYSLGRIDFDIEGASVADAASNDRRAQALAALQAVNPNLDVSFTLPVLPTGVTQEGLNLLLNAVQRGVRISTVNLMTFDYGSAFPGDMGDLAIQAAHAVADQLAQVYPTLSQAERRAMIGVTPMFGNDDQQRPFTQADAQDVLTAAKNENWARLSGWGIHRDHACPYGSTNLTCSGIAQSDWAFSTLFKQFP